MSLLQESEEQRNTRCEGKREKWIGNFYINIQSTSKELGISFWLWDLVPSVTHRPETTPRGSLSPYGYIWHWQREEQTSNLCQDSLFKPNYWYFDAILSASNIIFIWQRRWRGSSRNRLHLYFLSFFFFLYGSILKSLLNPLLYCFCFMFWVFGCKVYGTLASQPGIKPSSLHWSLSS